MSIYNTGAVRVRVGSALVKGVTGNEQFSTYVQAGYLFKLLGESTWYQIAAITNATNFTLSSRYSNLSYRTLRSAEHTATMTTATKMYSGILSYYPVIQEAITITASGETFTDNGGGILTGNASPAGSGTINYDTGAWTITLGTFLTATAEMTASYYSGDTRTGMSYQVVTDYTPIYTIPEMSLNDINFAYIYTKAIRIIDSRLSYIASYGGGVSASVLLNLSASVNTIFNDLTNVHASLNTLFTIGGGDYSASIHELYLDDTDVHASLNGLFVAVSNLNASQNIRIIVNNSTATLITIATSNLNKIHRFSNTASCYVTFPTITSSQTGNWIWIRKKGIGGIDLKVQGANTLNDNASHIYNNNASQTNALLKLSIENATNFEIEDIFGDWVTY